jgi:hypothetical protein
LKTFIRDVKKGEPPVQLDIEKLMKLYNVPGLSVAVIEDYKIAWVKSYGVTEPGGTVPASTGSIALPIRSIRSSVASANFALTLPDGIFALVLFCPSNSVLAAAIASSATAAKQSEARTPIRFFVIASPRPSIGLYYANEHSSNFAASLRQGAKDHPD